MAKASKQKSLTALAKSLDTRKQPLPGKKGLGAAQRQVLERAVRPEVRPRIEAALARQPLATGRSTARSVAARLESRPSREAAQKASPQSSSARGAKARSATPARAATGSARPGSASASASVARSAPPASARAASAPSGASSSRSPSLVSARAAPVPSSASAARSAPPVSARPTSLPASAAAVGSASPVSARPASLPAGASAARGAAPASARPVSMSSSTSSSRGAAPVGAFTSRTSALSSLQRSPSPAPSKLPAAKALTEGDARRRYPRAEVHVRASLALADDPSRSFEATLPTVNLSVGGLFLESSFFLKVGTKLLVTLQLPRQGREVKVKGEVVRLESDAAGQSGFALRFTEYLDGSQVVLATHFLSPVLREFLGQYAQEHRFEASPEYLAHTADVLAAWELKKAELGGDVWALFSSGA